MPRYTNGKHALGVYRIQEPGTIAKGVDTERVLVEAFLGDGTVAGVRAHRMRLDAPDATGRQTPEPIEGSSFTLDAELVITALGFDPEDIPTLFGADDLDVTEWGTVRVNHRTMMTNLDGVFAAGDIVRGASLVVWAIREGRQCARSIDQYMMGSSDLPR